MSARRGVAPATAARVGALACARVGLVVDLAQAPPGEVGVDLRRRDLLVSEQLLDGAQVGAALEQVGRETMAQRVGRAGRGDAGAGEAARDDAVDRARREREAVGIEEEALVRRLAAREPLALREPGAERPL